MARKPILDQDDLFEVARYLANPDVKTEIHVEIRSTDRDKFELDYSRRTNSFELPEPRRTPYYIWPLGTNKRGMEMRIYFRELPHAPEVVKKLVADSGKWKQDRARINYTSLVEQLFECGFVVGENTSPSQMTRIDSYMRKKFPSRYPS